MLNSEEMEKARNVQLGLTQFERSHLPEKTTDNNGNEILICPQCTVDFPCERMLLFMLVQSIAALTSMLPTGNMANVLGRFSGSKK
jgi:hypothetical protein